MDSTQRPSSRKIAKDVDRLYTAAVLSERRGVEQDQLSDLTDFMNEQDETLSNVIEMDLRERGITMKEDFGHFDDDGYSESRNTIAGLVLFLMGFVFLPSWWVGSFIPRKPGSPAEQKWLMVNRSMTAVSTVLLIGMSVALIIHFQRFDTVRYS